MRKKLYTFVIGDELKGIAQEEAKRRSLSLASYIRDLIHQDHKKRLFSQEAE